MDHIVIKTQLLLMIFAVICLALETYNKYRLSAGSVQKPHILAFSLITSGIIFWMFYEAKSNLSHTPQSLFLFDELSQFGVCACIIGAIVALLFGIKTLHLKQHCETYFIFLSSLSCTIFLLTSLDLIVLTICGATWLCLMATLFLTCTFGTHASEIAMKMFMNALFFIIFMAISTCIAIHVAGTTDLLSLVKLAYSEELWAITIVFFLLCGLFSLAGIFPFHFAHIDAIDGGNPSIASLLFTNACLPVAFFLKRMYATIPGSFQQMPRVFYLFYIWLFIAYAFMCLRAIDQRKIRRTLGYLSLSQIPLAFLLLLTGPISVPYAHLYFLTVFLNVFLSFFCMSYGYALIRSPDDIHATWEDIAGLGRHKMYTCLCIIIGIASASGLPGTALFHLKIHLIESRQEYMWILAIVVLSMGFGAACTMRFFVFLFSKHAHYLPPKNTLRDGSPSLIIAASALVIFGLLPFMF